MTALPPDVERLRALLSAATPGPWQAMNAYQWDSIIGDIDGPDDGEMHYESVTDITSHHDRSRHNATLIVAAVNALPQLLALAEDGRRYRWLRDMPSLRAEISVGTIANQGVCILQRDRLDAAIDAALQPASHVGEESDHG